MSHDRVLNHSLDLLWKAWHGPEPLRLSLPADWKIRECRMADAPDATEAELLAGLRTPVAGSTLGEAIAQRAQKIGRIPRVCIAVDDLERPTETFRLLPPLLADLNAAGVGDDCILVVVSLGTHRPLTRQDLLKKCGPETVARLRIVNHDPHQNLVEVGVTSWGNPVRLNRWWVEADFRIGIGMLSPHGFAGYSGGSKIVMPGLTDIETIARNHQPAVQGLSGKIGQVKGNTRREEIEEVGRMSGLDFVVNTISTSRGTTAAVFAGAPEAAFQAAAAFAQKVYVTRVAYGNDLAIFNCFPKDTELLQALNCLNIWSSRAPERQIVKDGGTIVVITAASEGLGHHGLFGPGMRLCVRRDRHGMFGEILRTRRLAFVSPNLNRRDLDELYPPETLLFNTWKATREWLVTQHGDRADVALIPTGPLQIAEEDIVALG